MKEKAIDVTCRLSTDHSPLLYRGRDVLSLASIESL